MLREEDHGNVVSLLELRLQATETALIHSEHHAEMLSTRLYDLRSEIGHIGEEADKDVHSLLHEIEQQEAEIAAFSKLGDTPLALHARWEAEIADVRGEASALRRAEQASWERHAQANEKVETELAAIEAHVERHIGRRAATEQAVHWNLAAATAAESRASAAAAAIAKAEAAHASAISSAEAMRENCEDEVLKSSSARDAAEASAEAVEVKCKALVNQLVTSKSREKELLAECECFESASERYEVEAGAQVSEISNLSEELQVAEEALAYSRQTRLDVADRTFASEHEEGLEQGVRSMKATCEEELAAEAAACRASIEREQRLSVEARWLRLFRHTQLMSIDEQFDSCRAAWAAGCHKSREVAASKRRDMVLEVERQMEQGERRLQALEQMHVAQVEAANKRARAAAAEIREAQGAWQAQIRELRRELQETEARSNGVAVEGRAASNAVNDAGRSDEEGHRVQAQLSEESAEVKKLREELNSAEEAIGILVAGGDGGSGSLHV